MFLLKILFNLACTSKTNASQFLGNNLTELSVARLDPNKPNFSLYPEPSIDSVKISSKQ